MEIRIKDLTKIFPGDAKKNIRDTIAVKDLDFTVPDGKLVGLLGPSGCGKSTTLYMISGLQTPTSGEVWFGDQEVTNLSAEKRGIGLVFQNYALYPHMTIYKNIEFPLTNLQVEVPLVTFFDFNFVYEYENLLQVKTSEIICQVVSISKEPITLADKSMCYEIVVLENNVRKTLFLIQKNCDFCQYMFLRKCYGLLMKNILPCFSAFFGRFDELTKRMFLDCEKERKKILNHSIVATKNLFLVVWREFHVES